ncbi:MAG: carboxypeptidase regulatory-like domain-containing protein [Bacteroidetes bacterium]|nr:carboxypeptidase regulatory-like domain-containing protein [Bacteroidota bacterium]
MKTKSAITILLTLLLIACGKKTQVKGVVYSKHNIPIPNASIDLYTYSASDYPEVTQTAVATSNSNGEYQFSFRARKTHGFMRVNYHIKCKSDSGNFSTYSQHPLVSGQTNNIDIYLQ